MKTYLLFLLLLLLTFSLYSQNRDNELWTGPAFRFNLTKKLRLEIENQIRLNNDISSTKSYFPEFGIRYELFDELTLKFQYRYILRPDKNDRNRITLDITYTWKKKKFPLEIDNRLRLSDAKENNSLDKFTFLRDRLQFDYNLSKLIDPFADIEIFYRFNKRNEFRSVRYKFGIEWRITKDIDLETFFAREDEFNVNNPSKDNIFGLMLTYDIDLRQDK